MRCFFLNRKYYTPILENCIAEDYGFNMWTYSRVDSVRPAALELFKSAGVNWLALGIEAGNQEVRQEVSKGTFREINIRDVCNTISNSDINIISNYIFGFPDDTHETMKQTLDLALELNTEMANMYPCQALPGSPLYNTAKRKDGHYPPRLKVLPSYPTSASLFVQNIYRQLKFSNFGMMLGQHTSAIQPIFK